LIGALTSLCNTLRLFCPASLRLVPALVFPVLCVLLCRTKRPTPQSVKAGVPVSVVGTRFFWAACLLTSFSEGVYCNLDHALVPIMPQPDFDTFALIALGSLAALLVLSWAHKSSVWYAFLLVIPVLVAGYTAWPLLHRESPGLSLGGLLFGYALLKVYMVAAVLHTVSLRSDALQRRLLGLGSGAIVLLFWIGSHNSPWIAERIAAGSTINPLFAFLAFTIVACSQIFVVHLDSMGFFRTVTGTALPKNTAPGKAPLSLADSSLEELEVHFRERGLTRQQAMIAGMLTLKTPDPSICDTLHISPSTLKTHIRNIHRRLGISSRHELAWLVTAPPAQPGNEGQEDGSK
ncbi:MAG: LuxR C-terminal-related transcriptional regulator, partial [Bilophila sp.]